MAINYGSITGGPTADTVTDPQKLFQALPAKAVKYAYLRDVQGEVLRNWYDVRSQRDVVIKMNTGGGKTVVGLLALKSCINEGIGPAVYVAADHYLCSQVESEAADLRLTVVDDPRSLDFQTGRAILVIPVHTLANGMSKFGVGRELQIEIGSIVIDDAHACLATAEQQFTLSLPRVHPVFAKLLAIFAEDLRSQSLTGTMEIERGDSRGLVQVPYWAWMDKQPRVIAALADHQEDQKLKFTWPLLKEDLQLCRCFFTARQVDLVIGINGLLDELTFREDGHESFEQALMEIGLHLGFAAQRPEKEGVSHLDVLWGIGQLEYLLLACKSEATALTISKHYADEISGSINWFRSAYDHSCQAVPVIVHPSALMDAAASPPPGTRVIAKDQLAALRDACRGFATSVKDRLSEPAHVRFGLTAHHLLGRQVIDQYSQPVKKKAARTGTAA